MKCSLCGYEFSEEEMRGRRCQVCPLSKGCDILCCPNCNHQFFKESKTINLIKRIFKWRSHDEGEKKAW